MRHLSLTATARYRLTDHALRALTAALVLAAGAAAGWGRPTPAYRGTLTFARESPSYGPFSPSVVVDYDLATGRLTTRFDGLDADRAPTGETAFIARLKAGYSADHGVVVADARGVPGAPIFVCKDFKFGFNESCRTPRLSPDRQRVAFGTHAAGTLCKDDYGTRWGDFVVVRDRGGAELARFEGYYYPAWLPDGRLVMMGSQCRNAGVWIADRSLRAPVRVDGGRVATPGSAPAVSPDGTRLAFVWNRQLWMLPLDGRGELTQLTQLEHEVGAAAWSPDGAALAVLTLGVSMPEKVVTLFRPGDEKSTVVRPLPFYPFGPISWR